MPADFLFINHIAEAPAINDTTRRSIKQHVMKDIGKARRRPRFSKANTMSLLTPETEAPKLRRRNTIQTPREPSVESACSQCMETPLSIDPPERLFSSNSPTFGSEEASLASQISFLSAQHLRREPAGFVQLLEHYANNTDISLVSIRDLWFRQIFHHSATLHVALCMFKAWLCFFCPPTTDVLSYRAELAASNAKAIREIQEKLADQTLSHTDETIATIGLVVSYCCVQDNNEAAQIHLKGLRIIVKQRGGIEALAHNRVLQYFISLGDKVGAYHDNIKPAFNLPPLPHYGGFGEKADVMPRLVNSIVREWAGRLPAQLPYIRLFEELMICIARVKQSPDHVFLDNVTSAAGFILSLLHNFQLHSFDVLDGTNNDNIIECVRLAVPLAVAELRRRCGFYPSFWKKYTRDLRAAVGSRETDWSSLEILKVWLCGIGATETTDEAKAWFEDSMLCAVQHLPYAEKLSILRGVGDMIIERRPTIDRAAGYVHLEDK